MASPQPPKGWHPEDIKAEVRKRGSSLTEIALGVGLHPSGLSQSLRWAVPPANRAIAEFLGKPLHELWPQWYGADGGLLPSHAKRSDAERARHRQKRSAA